MNGVLIAVLAVLWLIVGLGCWVAWQLLRQNGRMLLHLDELEERLDQLEFGEPDGEPPDELERQAHHSVRAETEQTHGGSQGTDAAYPNVRMGLIFHRPRQHILSGNKHEGSNPFARFTFTFGCSTFSVKAVCVKEAPTKEAVASWFTKMGMPFDSITKVELEGERGTIQAT